MITYIAEIYEYEHDDFRMSCWSTNPCNKIMRKLSMVGSLELATKIFGEWCKDYTLELNEWRKENYPNYDKHKDESTFRVDKVYDLNSIKSL